VKIIKREIRKSKKKTWELAQKKIRQPGNLILRRMGEMGNICEKNGNEGLRGLKRG